MHAAAILLLAGALLGAAGPPAAEPGRAGAPGAGTGPGAGPQAGEPEPAGPAPEIPPGLAPQPGLPVVARLARVRTRILAIQAAETQEIVNREDLLFLGEGAFVDKSLTLQAGPGKAALVTLSLDWTLEDADAEGLQLAVHSNSALAATLGFSSAEVGEAHERRATLKLLPYQDHVHDLFVSRDLGIRLLAAFSYTPVEGGPRGSAAPTLVTFKVRVFEKSAEGKELVDEASLRSLNGKAVHYYLREEFPEEIPREGSPGARPSGPQEGAAAAPGDGKEAGAPPGEKVEERVGRSVIEARKPDSAWSDERVWGYKIPNEKRMERLQRKRERLAKQGKDLPPDELKEVLRARKRLGWRVAGVELEMRPVYAGRKAVRAEVKLFATVKKAAEGKEREVRQESFEDFGAQAVVLDLAKIAGEEDSGAGYLFEVRAVW